MLFKLRFVSYHGYSYYAFENKRKGLCFEELNYLFSLDDRPPEIDLVISNKPNEDSYLVKKSYFEESKMLFGVSIVLSDGEIYDTATNYVTDKYLKELPEQFYISVLA